MPFAQSKFRIVRTITLAGFSGDPDWLGDFDATAARAAGSITVEPSNHGQVDILGGFGNAAKQLIDPGLSTFELEVLALGAGDDPDGNDEDAIFRFEKATDHLTGPPGPPASETLDVVDIVTLIRRVAGPTIFAFRVTDLLVVPATATTFAIALRVG